MKTINYFTTLLFLGVGSLGWTQITVNNAELFEVGTKLTFQYCDTSGIAEGGEGANQTWDYSNLGSNGTPVSVEMMAPSSLGMGNQFPNADLVEKWTDGKLIFSKNANQSSKLVGFVDSLNSIVINYKQPMMFATRPIAFGDSIIENFTDEFSANGFDFKGGGTVQLKADGYGTLKLPHRIYQNTLRIKMTQLQTDTLLQFGSVSEFNTVTYLWYDGQNPSALLKINFIYSDSPGKSVSYLMNEPLGVNDIKNSSLVSVYPNPCNGLLKVKSKGKGELLIYNQLGVEVYQKYMNEGTESLDVSTFSKGFYFLKFRDEFNQLGVEQIVIQ